MRTILLLSLATLTLFVAAGLHRKPAPLTATDAPPRVLVPQQTGWQIQPRPNSKPELKREPDPALKPTPKMANEKLFARALSRLEQTGVASDADADADAHVAGAEVGLSGSVIGKLISLGDREPEARPRVLATFAACAENARSTVSVRAHCLASAVRMGERWGELFSSTAVHASIEVESLAARLVTSTTN